MALNSTSRPAVTGRILSKLPATLRAIGGLAVSKLNGIWTIYPNFSALNEINAPSLSDPTAKQIWVYDPVSGEYNVLTLAALGDALYAATSATSLSIGVGGKSFVTQSGKDFAVGSWGIAYSAAGPANYMVWQVTSYDGTALVVNATAYGGSGAHADWVIRASSPPGAPGKSTGYAYGWLTATTTSDPGSGNIKANNATFGSITEIYLSETDADSNGIAAALAATLSGTSTKKAQIKLYDPVTPSNFMTFDVTALTDNGTWDTLTVTPRSNGGAFTAALALRAEFVAVGDKGDTGAVPAVQFNYSTTTADADPGSGSFRLNNAAPASATAAYIDNNERGGTAVSAWLDTFDDTGNSTLRGTLFMFDPAVAATFYEFNVSGSVVDGTGYRKLTIAYVAGQGSFTNGGAVGFVFTPRGPAGTGDMTSTNNLSDVASAPTSRANLGVTAQIAPLQHASLGGL
jgi:hypothetical protein